MKDRRPTRTATLRSDERGAYYVEYTVVLCLVVLGTIAAIAGLSVPVVHYHDAAVLPLQLPMF
jgi:Flp pilus assembly pilin Flp